VREVRVQVADLRGLEQPVRQRDRLQQLLDVDLARAGERCAAVSERLRQRRRCGDGEAFRPAAERAFDGGGERLQVARPPAVQRGGERAAVRQVVRLRLDRVDDRMPVPALLLLDGLDDEQPDVDPGLFNAMQLTRDERLRDARKAHEDIADGSHSPGRHSFLGNITFTFVMVSPWAAWQVGPTAAG
jgi:hypothetical protein